MSNHFKAESSFQTDRLDIKRITLLRSESIDILMSDVLKIMSPEVTKTLPFGWQNIDSIAKSEAWLKEQAEESAFFVIKFKTNNENIGFLFLYEQLSFTIPIDIRVGYLLSAEHWGNGLASELIAGLITWCKSLGIINSITGGVEPENKGSIRVLEKNGFLKNNEVSESNLFYVYTFPNNNSNN